MYQRVGWKARQEDFRAQDIEFILSARGRPQLLDARITRLKRRVREGAYIEHGRKPHPDNVVWMTNRLNDLARAYHGRQQFVRAAEVYERQIGFAERHVGGPSPIRLPAAPKAKNRREFPVIFTGKFAIIRPSILNR